LNPRPSDYKSDALPTELRWPELPRFPFLFSKKGGGKLVIVLGASIGDSLRNSSKKRVFWLFCVFLAGCSAPAMHMKCEEIRMRLDHENLSEDQKGFMEQELKDCEQEIQNSRQRDSTMMKNIEKKFSPSSAEDSL
jgi:hypothetical protein